MFKIPATVQKYSKKGNTLLIKGVATAPTIDRDNERMTPEAIKKMAESVNIGKIPIRVEHEDKFYTDIGVWKNASINDAGHMEVEGEVDTELSLGKDLEVMLNKGAKIGMSIGGKVVDAGLTFQSNVGKSIRDYKDVILREITITKNPSVVETCVSIAKSVNVDEKGFQETAEAISLADSVEKKLGSQHQVVCEEIKKVWNEKNTEYITKMAPSMARNSQTDVARTMLSGWPAYGDSMSPGGAGKKAMYSQAIKKVDDLMKSVEVDKDYYAEDCFDGYAVKAGLSSSDLDTIVKIAYIISECDIKPTDMPKELQDWQTVDSLPAECFVVELDGRWFPHHNADFSVNMEWVKYYLSQLICGNYTWLTPKEYVVALCHLFQHYKMDALTKSGKAAAQSSTEVKKAHVQPVSAEDARVTFSEEAMSLLQKCYQFQVNKSGTRPQYQDEKGVMNDLSDKDIKKMASAYSAMMQDKSRRGTLGMMMAGTYRNQISVTQSKPERGLTVQKSTSSQSDDMAKKDETATATEVEKTEEKKEETTEKVEEKKVEGEDVEKKKKEEKKDDEAKKTETASESEEDVEKKKKKMMMDEEEDMKKAAKLRQEAEELEKKYKKDEKKTEKSAEGDDASKSTEVAKAADDVVEAKDVAKATDAAASTTEKKAGDATATDKAADVTKAAEAKASGETAKETEVAKTGAESQGAKDVEKSKEDAPAAVDVEAVAKKAAETATAEAIEKSVTPALKELTALVQSLQKSVESSQEDVKKSAKQTQDAHTAELEDVKKSVSGQKATLDQLTTLVTKIGQLPNVRKSVASDNFTDLQKKFSEGDNAGSQVDVEKAVDTYLKEHPGCAVHTAYAEVKKAMIAANQR